MANCAVVGINWGDEGKGRMVDLLSREYDIVVRFQGGGNAGHTVINDKGKFALHLLPSGIVRDGVVNILGNGVALDPENLLSEIAQVAESGVEVTPENLKISDRASLPGFRRLDHYRGIQDKTPPESRYDLGTSSPGSSPGRSQFIRRVDERGGRGLRDHPSGRL